MVNEIKLNLERNLSQQEIDDLIDFLKKEETAISNVEIKSINSIGMTGLEILISIGISYLTSIAASATYDLGKKIVSRLKEKGIDAQEAE